MSQPALVRSYPDSGVLLVGGTAGIGLASALGFAAAGVQRICLVGRNADRGADAVQHVLDQHPDIQVTFVGADAGNQSSVETAVEQAHKTLGSIDVLVNSTTTAYKPDLLHRTEASSIEGILVGQALPPMLATRTVLPLMQAQNGGSIVNIASDAAKVPTPGESVLGAAMAAIAMFTRVTAVEAKRNGVRVNCVTPSLVEGTATAQNVLSDGFSRSLFQKASAQAHLGVAVPEDLAALIVFLGGPAAARLTGQSISVNGGISAF
ncbi:SDR family oxidoreductase [Rhodococcoides fascians A25f]|uniref:SDR family NAD(P)-dependent oxidoreductase n=1 Tax=Rhodococcoides fascians TaxID=1828 RepID=UPI00055A2A1D|nr:SDR family oxidoreductase [Rhodococcus fascians]QII07832.1 SDR family oxidoreductase [Rhodococcus fascians A25f]